MSQRYVEFSPARSWLRDSAIRASLGVVRSWRSNMNPDVLREHTSEAPNMRPQTLKIISKFETLVELGAEEYVGCERPIDSRRRLHSPIPASASVAQQDPSLQALHGASPAAIGAISVPSVVAGQERGLLGAPQRPDQHRVRSEGSCSFSRKLFLSLHPRAQLAVPGPCPNNRQS